ncbi:MAG: ABC transporter permease [Actinomycetia bacterium]|nr:ABC transporter permease [Actinomycetes bacterium]
MVSEAKSPPNAEQPESDERVRKVSRLNRLLARPEFGAGLGAVLVWVFFAIIANDNNFASWTTFAAIMNRAAPLGILAVVVALLMIGGEFDLSIGSILGFAGMTIMVLTFPSDSGGFGWGIWPAILAALILALAIGAFNGVLVVATKLPSFIITLATLFIFRGLTIALTRMFTNRTQLGSLDEASGFGLADTLFASEIQFMGATFRVSILWWFAMAAVATWILLRSRQGNWIFGTGGDANAARNVGVPVSRVRIALFMGTAFGAFLVAVIQAVQFNGSDTLRGFGLEFQAIIAVVVGGTLLTGGFGSVIGASFGALIFAMVKQGIIITGVDGDWFQVFVGGVLVIAVIFNNYVRQKAAQR